MAERVIEGAWEDVIRRHDLRGRRVRVVVVDEGPAAEPAAVEPANENPWVRQLRAWAEGRPPVGHAVDDSREGIYGGMMDDPR